MKSKWIVEFFTPGSFCSDTWEKEYDKEIKPESVKWPDNAYAFCVYRQDCVENNGKKFYAKREQIGKMYYHPDSQITNIEQTTKHSNATSTLINNMKRNGWDNMIWTRWGNWPQPYNKNKMLILKGSK